MEETIGERLIRLREERGWTQYEAAKRANLAPWVVSRLEGRKDLGNIQVRVLQRLALLYAVTLDYLVHDVPEVSDSDYEPAVAVGSQAITATAVDAWVPPGGGIIADARPDVSRDVAECYF